MIEIKPGLRAWLLSWRFHHPCSRTAHYLGVLDL